jgi:putative membrane protein
MMLFVLPSAAVAVIGYLTYRFSFEDNELVIRSGLVFRKERHIPYARIQNIDAVQNVLHRLLNVVEIKIETGGGRSTEATMSVLPSGALAEMRARVFAERVAEPQHATDTAPAQAETASPALLQLGLKELMLCGLIENRGAVLIAASFGLVWELGLFDRFFTPLFGEPEFGRGVFRNLARSVISNATVSWTRIAMTLAAFVGVLVLIRILSMVWAIVRLYGFRLALIDGDARTEFGLLTRVAMTIPLRRVQTLTVRESPLHRYFARVAVKVDTAGGHADEDHQQGEREYIAPILRTTVLDDFTRAIVGVTLRGIHWQPPHPRAFRRELKLWLAPALVVCAIAIGNLQWYGLVLVPFATAWAVVGARQSLRHLGWAVTEDAMLFKRGWLWRRVIVVRFAKIQTVSRYETPFDRRTSMARIYIDTAGASAASTINIPYVPRDDAGALYERLAREAAQRQFRW